MTIELNKGPLKVKRVASIDPAAIDIEARTVRVAVASMAPYERSFGMEILNIDPASIDTSYLDRGASFLVQHNWDDLVGNVIEYSIDPDFVLRATIKFGRSARAQEIFQDIIDGIRPFVSLGYEIKAMEQLDPIEGKPAFLVTLMRIFEVSSVTIPADPTVGVGRSMDDEANQLTPEMITSLLVTRTAEPAAEEGDAEEEPAAAEQTDVETKADEPTEAAPAEEQEEPEVKAVEQEEEVVAEEEPTPVVDTEEKKEEDEAEQQMRSASVSVSQNDPRLEAELARVSALKQLGEKFGIDIAQRCIEQGLDVEQFKQLVIQSKSSKGNKMEIGLNQKEIERFSLSRAVAAQVSGNWSKAGFERAVVEAAAEARRSSGLQVNGVVVPFEVLKRSVGNVAGNFAAGGATLQTDIRGDGFIGMVYDQLVLSGLGATTIEAVSDFALPKGTRARTAKWLNENEQTPQGQMVFSQVPFKAKRIGDSTVVSKRLLNQSTVSVDQLLMADFAEAIALGVQEGALYGDGVGANPLGLRNLPGVNKVAFAGAVPTRSEIIDMRSKVRTKNLSGNGYLFNSQMEGDLMKAPIAPNYPSFLLDDGKLINTTTAVSNVMADGEIFYGLWSDLVFAHFSSGIEFIVNPYAYDDQNAVKLTVSMDADLNFRRAESFTIGAEGLV